MLQIKTNRFQISTSVSMRCCKFHLYMSSRLESWTTHTLPLGTEWTHISTRQLKSAVSNYIALTFTSLGFYSSLTFQQQRTYITIYIQQSLAFLSLQTLWYIIISGMLVLSTRYLISNRNCICLSLNAHLLTNITHL